ncbi:MAG TPA: TadE family protein [Gaiellaceae bacterium]|nr:TadE family protein [Gaiellaceae bacterium]
MPTRLIMPARAARREDGQTAVEFALVAPILIVLLLGIIQLGVTFHNYVTITDAARAGARQAIVARFSGGTTTTAENTVRAAAGDLDQSKLDVAVTPASLTTAGSTVTVTATYPYEIDIPLLGLTVMSGDLTATAKEQLE